MVIVMSFRFVGWQSVERLGVPKTYSLPPSYQSGSSMSIWPPYFGKEVVGLNVISIPPSIVPTV